MKNFHFDTSSAPVGLLAQQALSANTAEPAPPRIVTYSFSGGAQWSRLTKSRDTAVLVALGRVGLFHRFSKLAARWTKETRLKSRAADIVMNDAYQRIIAMGPQVVPLIFRAMRKEGDQPRYWFWALDHLTDANIKVPENDRGDSVKMRELWLKWADDNGYGA